MLSGASVASRGKGGRAFPTSGSVWGGQGQAAGPSMVLSCKGGGGV